MRRFSALDSRLKDVLGPATELQGVAGPRPPAGQDRRGRRKVTGSAFPRVRAQEDLPTRALAWTATVIVLLLVRRVRVRALPRASAARARGRRRARGSRRNAAAAARRADRRKLRPSTAASTRCSRSLRQIEHDRALLLAGVSHDLRTPLARLRLGVEMGGADPTMRDGMVADIEEMDRIVGQFLDFARGDENASVERADLDDVVRGVVARYRAGGRDVAFTPGELPMLSLRTTAVSRLLSNLVDNAFAYGRPPVEIVTRAAGDAVTVDIMDRGPGVDARGCRADEATLHAKRDVTIAR